VPAVPIFSSKGSALQQLLVKQDTRGQSTSREQGDVLLTNTQHCCKSSVVQPPMAELQQNCTMLHSCQLPLPVEAKVEQHMLKVIKQPRVCRKHSRTAKFDVSQHTVSKHTKVSAAHQAAA